MRKNCNFQLPSPLVLQSLSKGLLRNGYVKYIIYPDLSKFKRACRSCPYIYRADKRYFCKLNNNEFMLKFYGVLEGIPSGVLLCMGGVPSYIMNHRVGVDVDSYFSRHSQSPKRCRVLRTKNKSPGDTRESPGALPVQSKQVGSPTKEERGLRSLPR